MQKSLLKSHLWPPTKRRNKSMLKLGIPDMIPENMFFGYFNTVNKAYASSKVGLKKKKRGQASV